MLTTRLGIALQLQKKVFSGLCHLCMLLLFFSCSSRPAVKDEKAFFELAPRTLSSALHQITEKYITPLPLSVIAIEGLRGLDVFDNSFVVKLSSNSITISADEFGKKIFSKPIKPTVDQWASSLTEILKFSRAQSAAIGSATQEKLFEAIFDGSTSILDQYSRYFGATQARINRARRSGFGGIGIGLEIVKAGAKLNAFRRTSSARDSGLKVGDIITHINGIGIIGKNLNEVKNLIRGKVQSHMEIRVTRNSNQNLIYSVRREREFPSTTTIEYQNKILILSIKSFNNDTARQAAAKIYDHINRANHQILGMIVDLRNNPGGVLGPAIEVADLFLEHGKIVTTQGRHPLSQNVYFARDNDILNGLPIVVIINGKSASASEIVASALQDNQRAIVIGTSSFGKGSVQSVNTLPNNGELALTWSRFVSPSGYHLNKLGTPLNLCLANYNGEYRLNNEEILKLASNFREIYQRWQNVSLSDIQGRKKLRDMCPSSKQNEVYAIHNAKTLLLRPLLYAQIISLHSSFASIKE